MQYKNYIFTIFLVLVLAALACASGVPSALPTGLPSIPTLDPDLSDNFEEQWQKSIVEAVTTGNFSVTITEGQFTDFLNRKTAENPESALSNIQVFLRDGQIQIYSVTDTNSGSTTLQIIGTLSVTAEGKLQISVISAQLGNFPVPDSILTSVSKSINDALSGQGTTGSDQIQFQSIVIAEGYLTISGTLK